MAKKSSTKFSAALLSAIFVTSYENKDYDKIRFFLSRYDKLLDEQIIKEAYRIAISINPCAANWMALLLLPEVQNTLYFLFRRCIYKENYKKIIELIKLYNLSPEFIHEEFAFIFKYGHQRYSINKLNRMSKFMTTLMEAFNRIDLCVLETYL